MSEEVQRRHAVHVTLTLEQVAQLYPLFHAVNLSNMTGQPAAIIAQVWPDGFVAVVLQQDEARKVAMTLGGDQLGESCSAEERMLKSLSARLDA